jgi:hypothetical protein
MSGHFMLFLLSGVGVSSEFQNYICMMTENVILLFTKKLRIIPIRHYSLSINLLELTKIILNYILSHCKIIVKKNI